MAPANADNFPIVDIANLSDSRVQSSIAETITHAAATWGFLLLKNHPISLQQIDDMFSTTREFFLDVPATEKIPFPVSPDTTYVGYNHPQSDNRPDDKASMWLGGRPGSLTQRKQRLPPFWRERIPQVEKFKHSCHELVLRLLECFAIAMGLPEKGYFAKAHAEDAGNGDPLRLIHYPARDARPERASTRMTAHSDSVSVTLLFQSCEGLEVEAPGGSEWVLAPHLPGHILVNLGDALAFWSGGKLKATRHRVTFEAVPHDVERISMAYFGSASPETVLEPVKMEGVPEMKEYKENGRVLKPGITVGEYSRMVMQGIYGKAKE